MLSIVIPVYKNEASLDRLLSALSDLPAKAPVPIEVVFVVDGSPDGCLAMLRQRLPGSSLDAQVLSLSRNFGSFGGRSGTTNVR